ncbi:unnamed protein product [Ilex paraguariensis]|uniref:Uncharacterized protein n=1 Tax=Ilex paraguariensis TaxID=185542 RepID=A0ABC8SP07_9AQUA
MVGGVGKFDFIAATKFEKQDGVVLMATTRNLKQIDEALQRPGRMDRIFHLQRPTQAEREKILRVAAKETMDEELTDFLDWRKVAEKTALLRPIELKLVPVALEAAVGFLEKFVEFKVEELFVELSVPRCPYLLVVTCFAGKYNLVVAVLFEEDNFVWLWE